MLTFFTTAKPFRGHDAIIQRDALIWANTGCTRRICFCSMRRAAWKYFRHLLNHPWTYGEIMTRRHRVYSYMRACSALFLGYHHLHLFDDARRKRAEWMASSSAKTLVALPTKAKAAAATKS